MEIRGIFHYYRLIVSCVLLCVLVAITTSDAIAHKVNIFAYVEGDMVYTESYFSDGKKVKGGIVEVYDSKGNKLLTGTTNEKGEFNFKPPREEDLKIVLRASLGHQNTYTLSREEISGMVEAEKPQEQASTDYKVEEAFPISVDQIKEIINHSLDEKLRPIMRQLSKAEQGRVSVTEVIGGIGYIFGIMGLIFYVMSKKKG